MPPLATFEIRPIAIRRDAEQSHSSCSQQKGPIIAAKAKKSVSFNEKVNAKRTLHISSFSHKEVEASWFSDNEFDTMKQEVRFAASLMNSGLLEQDEEYMTRRGLEKYDNDGPRRRQIKKTAREVVLVEQGLQKEEKSYDTEYIATIYREAASSSKAIARAMALEDELDAIM